MFDEPKESEITGEPTIVVGVVHPRGSAGIGFGASGWTLQFAFETWRGEDHVLHGDELFITRQVTEEELRAYMNRIQPYAILSARVVFTKAASAELVEILETVADSDGALAQRAAELLNPVTFKQERFGTFTLNRGTDINEAKTSWLGKTVRLVLLAKEPSAIAAALRVAGELWDNQATWSQRINDFAVQTLLDLKNDVWLDTDKGETELTPDEFISRMTLESIEVSPDGDFSFWHDDGGFSSVILSTSAAAWMKAPPTPIYPASRFLKITKLRKPKCHTCLANRTHLTFPLSRQLWLVSSTRVEVPVSAQMEKVGHGHCFSHLKHGVVRMVSYGLMS